jgi:DNA repair ATPase RecN
MPSNSVHALKGLTRRKRVQSLRDKVTKLHALRDQLSTDLEDKERELQTLSSRQELLLKVVELYRVLMDQMILSQVKVIESVVSEGLKTIFYDQDLRFKVELSSRANKVSADLYICQGDPEKGGLKGDPLESFGGGPASIASLILRILTTLRLGRKKVLFLDESLVAVSGDYVETTGQFLKKLSETTDLPILMVTHNPAFLDHATVSYQGDSKTLESGKSHFIVKKMRT